MRRWVVILVIAAIALIGGREPASAQQKVTVLCSPNPAWCDAIKAEFAKATGTQLDFIRLSSGEALARLRAEKGRPSFDVWFGGTGDPHIVAAEEGLTEFYKPQAWEDIRPQLREAVQGKYIPLYAGVLGWAINDKLLKEKGLPVPKKWADLADPKYKGLLAMPNPNTSGTGYTTLATIMQIYGDDQGWALMKQIHKNMAQYTRSGADPGLLTGRGEVGLGITFMHDAVDQVVKGFPITYGAAEEGMGYEIGGLSLVKASPNRDAAVRFIDWALTPEAQRLAAERGQSYQVPSNAKTPVPKHAPRFEDYKVIKYDFAKYGSKVVRDGLVKKWTTEVFPQPK
jgi:iron(III) transport system substrate-binding protein